MGIHLGTFQPNEVLIWSLGLFREMCKEYRHKRFLKAVLTVKLYCYSKYILLHFLVATLKCKNG